MPMMIDAPRKGGAQPNCRYREFSASDRRYGNVSERGAAAVELAVTLPILMMFIFGVVEFGRVFSVMHVMNTAAREGARIAVLPGSDNAKVEDRINQILNGSGLTADAMEFSPANIAAANRNEPVMVRVAINFDSVALFGSFMKGLQGKQMQSMAIMRKEGLG